MPALRITQITMYGDKTWVAMSQATGQCFEFLVLEGAENQLEAIHMFGSAMVVDYQATLNAIPRALNMTPLRAPEGTAEMTADAVGEVLLNLNDSLIYVDALEYEVEEEGEVLLEFLQDVGRALLGAM